MTPIPNRSTNLHSLLPSLAYVIREKPFTMWRCETGGDCTLVMMRFKSSRLRREENPKTFKLTFQFFLTPDIWWHWYRQSSQPETTINNQLKRSLTISWYVCRAASRRHPPLLLQVLYFFFLQVAHMLIIRDRGKGIHRRSQVSGGVAWPSIQMPQLVLLLLLFKVFV